MRINQRKKFSRIMFTAWELARQGAKSYGGGAYLYFPFALHLAWQEEKSSKSVWRRGVGNQFLLPSLPLSCLSKNGQGLLPGISLCNNEKQA